MRRGEENGNDVEAMPIAKQELWKKSLLNMQSPEFLRRSIVSLARRPPQCQRLQ